MKFSDMSLLLIGYRSCKEAPCLCLWIMALLTQLTERSQPLPVDIYHLLQQASACNAQEASHSFLPRGYPNNNKKHPAFSCLLPSGFFLNLVLFLRERVLTENK